MLRILRIIISLLFFVILGFAFIDFDYRMSERLIDTFTWIQFFPSLISFIFILGFSAVGFVVIMILTLIFGRIYCSSICPLGTLQDILSRILRRKKKRKRYQHRKAPNWVRYPVAIITLGLLGTGNLLFVNLLDPFSVFGKICSNLVRPGYMFLNNAMAWVLEKFDNYQVSPVEIKGFTSLSVGYAILLLVVIGFLVAQRGRLFCNLICPVGSVLALMSKRSLLRIQLNQHECNQCGLCVASCKVECINSESKTVDMSRCVVCFDCLSSCNRNGISYGLISKKGRSPVLQNVDVKRRLLLGGMASGLMLLPGLRLIAQEQQSRVINKEYKAPIPVKREYPVSPPGSLGLDHFNESCTGCHLCITACPTNVLTPAITEYGLNGIMQPRMNYLVSFCNFECNVCSQICPTGAISSITIEEKKEIQIGKVHFVKDNCIVITEKTECGACAEHCPTKAVDMIVHENRLFLPEVNQDICVGCGACEYACPTGPKAIYVDGNPVHLKADKPNIEAIEEKFNQDEDFPF